MAKTLTLEEAAQQLGLSVEQFKTNLKTHKTFMSLRPLMGGATMHFREQDIAELGRKLGQGSDADLQSDDEQVEIGREPQRAPGASGTRLSSQSNPRTPKPKAAETLPPDSSDEFVPLTPDEGVTKSGRRRDSDVRVDSGKKTLPPAAGTPPEEVIDLARDSSKSGSGKGSGKTPKSSGRIKSSGKKDDGSEFELKLGTDSDSEFELTLADDSDEVPLGGSSRDATGKTGKSGVKLNRPDDSGISLEKDSDSDFELNLDSSSSKKMVGPKPSSGKNKGKKKGDSDSEFELALDDSSGEIPAAKEGEKDIFATDFDIPALDDSASEAVALEDSGDTDLESSDFDLDAEAAEVDESASEVVQLDDDLVDGDVVEVDDKATSGKKKKRRRTEDDDLSADEALADVDEEEEEEGEMAAAGAPAPTRWGPLPALVLFPCLFVLMIVSFMGFELLHGMWSYRSGGSKPTYTLTRGIAGMFSDSLPSD